MTDNELTIKALKEILELMLYEGDLQRTSAISNAIDLINRQKAEIERLEKGVAELADESDARDIDEYNMVCRVRAEAIKEFAERFKRRFGRFQVGLYSEGTVFGTIDNLVKEMVGDVG